METSQCIICNSSNSSIFLKIHDRLQVVNELFELKKCQCGFIFLNPRPTIQEIKKYYNIPNYDPHNVNSKTIWNKLYKKIQFITSNWKRKMIENRVEKGKLLDVGGGGGDFAHVMSKQGWDVTLYDKFISSNLYKNLKVINDLNNFKKSNQFNAITLWHSLEHIHDINVLFENLNKLISDKGILLIAVPNINAFERKIFGVNWAPYDAPRHLYHFTPESLNKLLNKKGFYVIKQKTILQDTPYNIILSMELTIIGFFIAIATFIVALVKILIFGPTSSSSFLFICKKK